MLLVFQLLEWISHPGVQQFSVNLHKDKQVWEEFLWLEDRALGSGLKNINNSTDREWRGSPYRYIPTLNFVCLICKCDTIF